MTAGGSDLNFTGEFETHITVSLNQNLEGIDRSAGFANSAWGFALPQAYANAERSAGKADASAKPSALSTYRQPQLPTPQTC